MRPRILTMETRKPVSFTVPVIDGNKITLRMDSRSRLCAWPGSCSRWIEKDDGGDLKVEKFPCVGRVEATRFVGESKEQILGAIPEFEEWLNDGLAVVIGKEQMPENLRSLV